MQFHKWGLGDFESMFPFERDIFLLLLTQHLEEEEAKANKNK